jgi:hypothetical protein
LAAIDSVEKLIVDIGQPIERFNLGESPKWAEMEARLRFIPIYDPMNLDIEISANSLWFIKSSTHSEITHLLLQAFDSVSLQLWLPGDYWRIPEDRRKQFEFLLQKRLKLRKMTINGHHAGWAYWQYKLVNFYSRISGILGIIIPNGIMFFCFYRWPEVFSESINSWWEAVMAMIGLFVSFSVFGFLVEICLLPIYRIFVPKRLFMLAFSGRNLRDLYFSKWLMPIAERVLADTPTFFQKNI